jgi:MYXO-CTERM domain-containing protein
MKAIHFGLGAVATVAVTGLASADVIMDQIGSMDGSAVLDGTIHASQEFIDYGAYSIVAMDDFSISEDMYLTSASMVLGGWNGYPGDPSNVSGYTISIFSSFEVAAGDLYGDVVAVWSDPVSWSSAWMGNGHLLTFDLGGVFLAAGDYWLGITPLNHFAAGYGQTGVWTSSIGDGSGHQANPGGGFGMPDNWSAGGMNYAYSLEGTAVPAPGVLALLGLAGFAGRRRRS